MCEGGSGLLSHWWSWDTAHFSCKRLGPASRESSTTALHEPHRDGIPTQSLRLEQDECFGINTYAFSHCTFQTLMQSVVRQVMLCVDLELDNKECHKNAAECHKGSVTGGK